MRGLLVAGCLTTLAVAACSSGSGKPVAATTPTTVVATTVTTIAATTIAIPTTTLAIPSVGDPVRTTGGNALTVHGVEAPTRPNRTLTLKVDHGMQFTAVDVEVCVGTGASAPLTWSETM